MDPPKDELENGSHVSNDEMSEAQTNNTSSQDDSTECEVTNKEAFPSSISKDTGFCSDSVASSPSLEGVKDVLSESCASSGDTVVTPPSCDINSDSKLCDNEQVNSDTDTGQLAAGDSAPQDSSKKDEEEVMDILGNGLLKKTILVPGKENSRPTNGDTVTVKVDGVLENGTHVDVEELKFVLNDGDVIMALDLAVSLMDDGETCQLFTDARYAYGSLGRKPDIPSESSITYTLQLVEIEPRQELSTLSVDQRLSMGEAKRERGNHLYARQDFTGAINSYTKAVKILDNPDLNAKLDDATRTELSDSWVKCYNNMAACQLKVDAPDAAIRSCNKVLSVQPENVKALFRIGKAHGAKNDVDQALIHLRKGIKLDPESKMLHQEVLNLARRQTQAKESEKEMYQRMLGLKPGESGFIPGGKKKQKTSSMRKWILMAGSVAAVLASVGITWYRTSM